VQEQIDNLQLVTGVDQMKEITWDAIEANEQERRDVAGTELQFDECDYSQLRIKVWAREIERTRLFTILDTWGIDEVVAHAKHDDGRSGWGRGQCVCFPDERENKIDPLGVWFKNETGFYA
jgi:hypothetical protein